MPELLIELRGEEIPARMQARAAADFQLLMTEKLTGAGLSFENAESYVTPRRLTLVVNGLPDRQPDRAEERKGPREGAPEKAVEGFLKAAGLESLGQAELRDTGKARFYFAVRQVPGAATADLIPGFLRETVARFPWPKSMRWATGKLRWVRPLQGLVCLFAGTPLRFALEFEGILVQAGATTVGHRFLAPNEFSVAGFADYRDKLRAAYVILDPAERRASIEGDAARIAAEAGLSLVPDPGLLDEVTGLVEWPVVLLGDIDDAFMQLPPEVLTASMRAHQKYFALRRADGALAPHFAVVSNMVCSDGGQVILQGNARVLRARLSDARFFWEQDRATPLDDLIPGLADVVFHAKLGSLADKVTRIEALAVALSKYVPDCDADLASRAARLCKADLRSGMVGEFPELQGAMGRHHALDAGEKEAVADAIAAHYGPLGPSDACPTAPVSVAVALADKIDTLIGFWAIDEKPTGSRDPHGLRRAGLGVIRLIVENGLHIPLTHVFENAFAPFASHAASVTDKMETVRSLLDFLADRMKIALREKGVRHDLVQAVFALGDEDDLVRLLARVDALDGFLGSGDGANLLIAYRRAANILRIEEKKDGRRHDGAAEAGLLREAAESDLLAALGAAWAALAPAVDAGDFVAAMAAMAPLRGPVDAFFDDVTVNADDPELRANRLRLLGAIRDTMGAVADFSRVDG